MYGVNIVLNDHIYDHEILDITADASSIEEAKDIVYGYLESRMASIGLKKFGSMFIAEEYTNPVNIIMNVRSLIFNCLGLWKCISDIRLIKIASMDDMSTIWSVG